MPVGNVPVEFAIGFQHGIDALMRLVAPSTRAQVQLVWNTLASGVAGCRLVIKTAPLDRAQRRAVHVLLSCPPGVAARVSVHTLGAREDEWRVLRLCVQS